MGDIEKQWERIMIGSFRELLEHEQEIVKRIAATANGGNLFMIHPLMLLSDVGVDLSSEAVKEILQHEPLLSGLSPTPYKALKTSKEKQNIQFHVRGLFRRSLK
jgi:hypothetical protein